MTASPLDFHHELRLGNLAISNRLLLAPLAGITDAPFRRICQEMGAGLTYVEMVSACAINYENRRTLDMLRRHPSEHILGVQVEGGSAEGIAKAVRVLDGMGFDTIDINMGCPVRKVVNSGGGSGLLRFPELISQILVAARAETRRPLSVKYRLGFTRDAITVEDTTARAIRVGLDMVTIHGRTRSEGYGDPVDYPGIRSGIAFAHENGTLLANGNGNVFTRADAEVMLRETSCDGVMVARGALGNPWVFRDILHGPRPVTLSEWLDVVMRHLAYAEAHHDDARRAAILMRKHLLWYAKGFPGTKPLRAKLCTIQTISDARTLLKEFASSLNPGHVRSAVQPEARQE